jgi:hypothetical protein
VYKKGEPTVAQPSGRILEGGLWVGFELDKHLAAAFLNNFAQQIFVRIKGIAAESLAFKSSFRSAFD